MQNIRLTLRQGDVPSMELFCMGIDPLLHRLERQLQGILIASAPVQGPPLQGMPPLPRLEQRYKLIGYADDNKPAITSMEEFRTVDNSLAMFEKASGCKLHRDPLNKKCKFLPLGRWRTTLHQADIPCDYMTLSDHLDMVGVTLMASWTKTRKVNGDALQLKVKNTINPWKAGKFLPVVQRGWSINSYALAKVWFRAKCIDLRVCDIKAITSSCKSWLYQDMFAKPEEMVLHRPPSYSGLGLQSVKYKALAGSISTFIQTAANPAYRSKLLHSLQYRKFVLEEDDVPGAPTQVPPYFSQDFFESIKRVKAATSSSIATLSEGDWCKLLTEDNITMLENLDENTREFRPCKAELASPSTDWTLSWSLCRQPGLSPDLSSFLWKMLLDLLSTQKKLNKMGANLSPICKLCKQDTGSLQHELLDCNLNDNTGQLLLSTLQSHIPSLTSASLLHLEFSNLEEKKHLPATILTAVTLSCIWKERTTISKVRAYQVRSELEQTINLLRTTRLANVSVDLQTMIDQMFH